MFEEYLRLSEPDKAEKAGTWQMAVGLQAVDGLQVSEYLLDTARRHIEGHITIREVRDLIDSYYRSRSGRQEVNNDDCQEADKVSARIAEIAGEKSFSFSPAQLSSIHRRLFDGILSRAGEYRDYDFLKREWVLRGDTVMYAHYADIGGTLDFDFSQERNFRYKGRTPEERAAHLARFCADIWQVHPFREGNTRTTAVFMQKYINSLGFVVDNEPFKDHSWYFRNALVRANYNNQAAGVEESTEYLYKFFGNLLLRQNNVLSNRELHVDWPSYQGFVAERKNIREWLSEYEKTGNGYKWIADDFNKICEDIRQRNPGIGADDNLRSFVAFALTKEFSGDDDKKNVDIRSLFLQLASKKNTEELKL